MNQENNIWVKKFLDSVKGLPFPIPFLAMTEEQQVNLIKVIESNVKRLHFLNLIEAPDADIEYCKYMTTLGSTEGAERDYLFHGMTKEDSLQEISSLISREVSLEIQRKFLQAAIRTSDRGKDEDFLNDFDTDASWMIVSPDFDRALSRHPEYKITPGTQKLSMSFEINQLFSLG